MSAYTLSIVLMDAYRVPFSQVIEDVMKHEHLQNKATALEMKLKEEEMLRKKAEEEQRRITRELVKVQREEIGWREDSEDNCCVH